MGGADGVDPVDGGVVRVRECVEMKVAIVLAEPLQLQPAIQNDLAAFTELGLGKDRQQEQHEAEDRGRARRWRRITKGEHNWDRTTNELRPSTQLPTQQDLTLYHATLSGLQSKWFSRREKKSAD